VSVNVRERARSSENPFYILELPPTATRAEIERAGQRLIAELTLERESAKRYQTPLGPMERTADAVRGAVAELRDPARRLVHELWAAVPVSNAGSNADEDVFPWSSASRAFGLKPK